MTQRDHTVIASILVLVAFFAIKIGSLEIQPWDEGLYAVRGEGITLFDNWWDQTGFSLGGLYSSTPPPVAPWGVAIGTSVLGHTPLGVRAFTLVCSALALWFLYGILKRMVDQRSAFIGVGILGTSLHWVVYSRQAMTEVPLMMFILGCLLAVSRLMDPKLKEQRDTWITIALFGVCFGGALMTKLVVSFIPLLFVVPAVFDKQTRSTVLIALAIGLAIAAPWYGTMISTYGNDWLLSMSLPHLSEAVEGNTSSLGFLYYVNQLIVAQPLLIAAFLFVPVALLKRDLLPSRNEMLAAISLLWFVAGMLVFSFAQTKNPHYVVILLPAAVLSAVWAFDKIVMSATPRMAVMMYSLVGVSALWSLLRPLRATLRLGAFDPIVLLVLATMGVLVIAPILLKRTTLDLLRERGYRIVAGIAIGAAAVSMALVIFVGRPEDIQGGRAVAKKLLDEESSAKTFIYLYHRSNAGDAMNPQLAWYTNGWMAGWLEDRSYSPIHMPPGVVDTRTLSMVASASEKWLVYYHPRQSSDQLEAATNVLAVGYTPELTTPHYTLYRRSF